MELILVRGERYFHTSDEFGVDIISDLEKSGVKGVWEVSMSANALMNWLEANFYLRDLFAYKEDVFTINLGLKNYPLLFEKTNPIKLYFMDRIYVLDPSFTYLIRNKDVYRPTSLTFYRKGKPDRSLLDFVYDTKVEPVEIIRKN